ncbi:hypothetical protein JKG68_13790 [Microvirga aerilata]|uniref:Uncharacterized protein n=1 Tax=Microvirga aerilata TaxID=670292 RepID=A0A937CY50_9HYPH|nr:hypothetical protein [Microvirga aerilata]MBL0405044.1 hypothetical protein [Microvirga aerilata]
MQTETVFDPSERIITIKYSPERYDAFPPAANAWMDGRITDLNRDREAAAHALLLLAFVSGRFCPSRGCGADVAGSLRDLFSPRNVLLEGVDLSPARIPSGIRTAILGDGSYRMAATVRVTRPDVVFKLSESAQTTLAGPRNMTISSNFGLFSPGKGQLNALIPTIAAALLFSEDAGLGRLVLPVNDLDQGEVELIKRLTALLAAVNIAVDAPLLGKELHTLSDLLLDPASLELFFAEGHEYSNTPDDLPDFWFVRLLWARRTGSSEDLDEAAARLRSFSEAGHFFSPREQDMIRSGARTHM